MIEVKILRQTEHPLPGNMLDLLLDSRRVASRNADSP